MKIIPRPFSEESLSLLGVTGNKDTDHLKIKTGKKMHDCGHFNIKSKEHLPKNMILQLQLTLEALIRNTAVAQKLNACISQPFPHHCFNIRIRSGLANTASLCPVALLLSFKCFSTYKHLFSVCKGYHILSTITYKERIFKNIQSNF